MNMFFPRLILVALLLAPGISVAQLSVVNYRPYADRFDGATRLYTFRISAMVPAVCQAMPNVRSSNGIYPGDYFWPAFAGYPSSLGLPQFKLEQLDAEEKQSLVRFLKEYFPEKFHISALIDSIRTYTYGCYSGDRHEFYLMLSEGDTIYVISGWFGKFMSLFQAVPSNKILTPADFIKQIKEIAPALRKSKLSDSLVSVDNYVYGERGDTTFFMQAYDPVNRMWFRNYPTKLVLPPADPAKGKEKPYNIIEISQIYDEVIFNARAGYLLKRR